MRVSAPLLPIALLVALGFLTHPILAQEAWTPEQEAVWKAVQARWQAWQDNDLDTYLALHHKTWHRWALHSEDLESKTEIKAFWERAKEFEETLAFTLEPVAVQIYGDGRFAAVHYIADESVRLLKERVTRDGRTLPVGNETNILIRFSDFMVREGEDWLFVGGYRDGSCVLFRGFGRLCDD